MAADGRVKAASAGTRVTLRWAPDWSSSDQSNVPSGFQRCRIPILHLPFSAALILEGLPARTRPCA